MDDNEDYVDPAYERDLEDRVIDLEAQVSAQARMIKLNTITGLLGAVSGVFAALTLSKMAKVMGQYGMVLQAHDDALKGVINTTAVPVAVPSADGPAIRTYQPYQVDETRIGPRPDKIAEPTLGPESEASQRVRDALATDPIAPSELIKDFVEADQALLRAIEEGQNEGV